MKNKFYYITIFVLVLFATSCSNTKDAIDNENDTSTEVVYGTPFTLDLSGALSGENTRIIYNIDDNYFPKPQSFVKGDKKEITCIIRSDDNTQPITKVKVEWEVTGDRTIKVKEGQKITLASGTNLSKGNW